jgi:hypothetical protein
MVQSFGFPKNADIPTDSNNQPNGKRLAVVICETCIHPGGTAARHPHPYVQKLWIKPQSILLETRLLIANEISFCNLHYER